MSKDYKLGMIVGRFQCVHIGHMDMIRRALNRCERVCVLIGSAQEGRSEKNPFYYHERKGMLCEVFPFGIEVFPLEDMGYGNNPTWGKFVIDTAEKLMGEKPDYFVTGEEKRRENWFIPGEGPFVEIIPKENRISSSEMRQFLFDGDLDSWKRYTPSILWPKYRKLRDAVIESAGHTDTDSI